MKKTIKIEDAVGVVLVHDITEIRKGDFKGTAFKKGHIIKPEDIDHLKRLGKDHIFALTLTEQEIHENNAALKLAKSLCGPGSLSSDEPSEGKITITAAHDGLLKVDSLKLAEFNMLGEVMCATLHNNTPVKKGDQIGATRLIPLVGNLEVVDKAASIPDAEQGIISVQKIPNVKVGLVITGSEVFHGRIKDAFEQVLRDKLREIGSEVCQVYFAPDDTKIIADKIKACLDAGAQLIVTSGGMSVDPDDVTRVAIKEAGAKNIVYGTPVLPGAMFLVGYFENIPILGVPACGMYHKITILDLILPRVLCGEIITRQSFAEMGHGGLCRDCPECSYPVCGFGK
jgi:hypothetical protein